MESIHTQGKTHEKSFSSIGRLRRIFWLISGSRKNSGSKYSRAFERL
jgi:hypothetical protein